MDKREIFKQHISKFVSLTDEQLDYFLSHFKEHSFKKGQVVIGEGDKVAVTPWSDGTTNQALVDKIHRHAYKVTDDDLARLRPAYSDDELFEVVVSAALGAARQRLFAGLSALENA